MNPEDPEYSITYWLNASDIIVNIGPGWDDFALQNNATNLDVTRVIGRKLLNFVQGDTTKMYVRTILQSARLTRRPLVRNYRCDSPDQRRFMEMRLSMEDNGLLKWEHRLLRTENMMRSLSFFPAAGLAAAKCVVRCSMCNRLKSASGWQEPDVAPLPTPMAGESIPVIYGVCPDCLSTPWRQSDKK